MFEKVTIIGGGIIGLSIAFELTNQDIGVQIISGDLKGSASNVAAGMLAPLGEIDFGLSNHSKFNLACLNAWPDFAKKLVEMSQIDVDFHNDGVTMVAYDHDDLNFLKALRQFHLKLGFNSELTSPSKLRERFEIVSPQISGGLISDLDARVNNRKVIAALQKVLQSRKIDFIESLATELILGKNQNSISKIKLESGEVLDAKGAIILATGAFTNKISTNPPFELPRVFPLKGDTLRLKPREPYDEGVIRIIYKGRSYYLVIRFDEVVLGATQVDAGFDSAPELGPIYQMLEAAINVMPSLYDAKVSDISTGFRPATDDNLPFIGRYELANLYLAYGHWRNGILHAPLTAKLIAGEIQKEGSQNEEFKVNPSRVKIGKK